MRVARHRGFTLVELLTVMVVLGVLVGISILKYVDVRNSARAAALSEDFRSVMVASYNFYADRNTWPADAAAGVVPPELVPYLPVGFAFSRPDLTFDYDHLPVGAGVYIVGVTLTTTDTDLMNKLQRTLGTTAPYFSAGGSLTYIIVDARGGA
jgi:prepilin-type N-terminal cleavage/methylation domain-containing protein